MVSTLDDQIRALNRALAELGAVLVASLVLVVAALVAAVRRLRNR